MVLGKIVQVQQQDALETSHSSVYYSSDSERHLFKQGQPVSAKTE